MPLEPGAILGTYEILSSLGVGGMGEVYRARDKQLGREVALKLLLEEVASDPERLARFEREARVLASLSHPNVATLYGFERASLERDRPAAEGVEVPFLVMELVPGETLADRISRGPLPLEEAIPVFLQIAEGLEAAHEKGIVHRDLKPANVKVSARGQVKILDFGLAKAMVPEESGAEDERNLSRSPTLTLAATRRGEILGTAAYMAPEQAKGGAVDKRVDVWAFGCCLYEALTGERAFAGADVADTLAAVLRDTPDWDRAGETAPAPIRRLLRRCLVKDPYDRLRDIGDARHELREASDPAGDERAGADIGASPTKLRVRLALAVALGLIAGVLVANLMTPRSEAPAPSPTVRLSVTGENGRGFEGLREIALSDDGRQLAFVAENQLHLRRIADPSSQPLPGTQGAQLPVFSPDGEWIAFVQGIEIKKVPTTGGAPSKICEVGIPRGADWGDDGRIVVSTLDASQLLVVPAIGGAPRPLHPAGDPSENQPALRWNPGAPELLPGGHTVLAEEGRSSASSSRVVAVEVATGARSTLLEDARRPQVASTGHLLFLREEDLMAVPFDAGAVRITGTPVPVARGVSRYAVAGDLLATVASETQRSSTLVRVDRDGNETPFDMPRASYMEPRVSPDGDQISVTISTVNAVDVRARDVWIYDLDRRSRRQLTFNGAGFAVWSPAGDRLVVQAAQPEGVGLFSKPADGSAEPTAVTPPGPVQMAHSFTPRGDLLYHVVNASNWDVMLLPAGESEPQPFLATPAYESGARCSPDGRWVAYVSDEDGQQNVYVRPLAGEGTKHRISSQGGRNPVWSRDGRELFYRNGDRLMRVEVAPAEEGQRFSYSRPELLFDAPYFTHIAPFPQYDVLPDGDFVFVKELEGAPAHIQVVLHWASELESS